MMVVPMDNQENWHGYSLKLIFRCVLVTQFLGWFRGTAYLILESTVTGKNQLWLVQIGRMAFYGGKLYLSVV
jgi:hypothetical protein